MAGLWSAWPGLAQPRHHAHQRSKADRAGGDRAARDSNPPRPARAGSGDPGARTLLLQHEFSPSSDYFNRLAGVQSRLRTRVIAPALASVKRNYGGASAAAGCRSRCLRPPHPEHVLRRRVPHPAGGRVKSPIGSTSRAASTSVELKFLQSLHSPLDGQLRKLLLVRDFATIHKDCTPPRPSSSRPATGAGFPSCGDFPLRPAPNWLAWLVNIATASSPSSRPRCGIAPTGSRSRGGRTAVRGSAGRTPKRGGGRRRRPGHRARHRGQSPWRPGRPVAARSLCDEPGALAMVANIAAAPPPSRSGTPRPSGPLPRRGV